jgi:hypothetical protein
MPCPYEDGVLTQKMRKSSLTNLERNRKEDTSPRLFYDRPGERVSQSISLDIEAASLSENFIASYGGPL